MAEYESRRFTRIEYEKLIDLGVFQPGEALELLGGHLLAAEPQGAAHYTAVVKTARAVQVAFGSASYVRIQGPIEASLAFDRDYKASLYARGGVPDYWVLNLVDRVLEVYREPRADAAAPFGWRYTWSEVIRPGVRLAPLAAPVASVAVSQRLP